MTVGVGAYLLRWKVRKRPARLVAITGMRGIQVRVVFRRTARRPTEAKTRREKAAERLR
jgi:hypothetical protein